MSCENHTLRGEASSENHIMQRCDRVNATAAGAEHKTAISHTFLSPSRHWPVIRHVPITIIILTRIMQRKQWRNFQILFQTQNDRDDVL